MSTKKKKQGKTGRYGNVKKPIVDGHRFDSQAEADRYEVLKARLAAGEIEDLTLQPRFPIKINGKAVRIRSKRFHKNGRALTYIADFAYLDLTTGQRVIEDVKMQSGHLTDVYKIKRALMEAMGYRIIEV